MVRLPGSFPRLLDEFADFHHAFGVQAGGWLVQQEQVRDCPAGPSARPRRCFMPVEHWPNLRRAASPANPYLFQQGWSTFSGSEVLSHGDGPAGSGGCLGKKGAARARAGKSGSPVRARERRDEVGLSQQSGMLPEVGGDRNPARMLRRVVLPEPLGPRRPRMVPWRNDQVYVAEGRLCLPETACRGHWVDHCGSRRFR